ncbi:hypothetical protein ABW20_dc0107066 [Dactylellina cionopaga]|nr:hypothetical protein ABW20_dc0107066 [Dactylellina cionopaga]
MGNALSIVSAQDPEKCLRIMEEALIDIKREVLATNHPGVSDKTIEQLERETLATITAWEIFTETVIELFKIGDDSAEMDDVIEEDLQALKLALLGPDDEDHEAQEDQEAEISQKENSKDSKGKNVWRGD